MILNVLLSSLVSVVGVVGQAGQGGGQQQAPAPAQGQQPQQQPLAANKGDLVGTWVSGSQGVITGPGFVNPLNFSFNYPKVTGVSYSFTQGGFFEEAFYKFTVNSSQPNCITGVLQWQHGMYQALANGSIVMNPISSDGRQQVQDTCSPVSNIIQQFNHTVLMNTWEIRTDEVLGKELLLYQFDGTPVQPLYPYANPPIMLPTETLTANVSVGQMDMSAALPRSVVSTIVVGALGGLLGAVAVLLS